jgi:N-methylhydantoinase B
VPAEIIENVSPLFMRKRELIQDSGGAGKYRGGLGQEMILRIRTRKPAVHSPMYDRLKFPAKGYAGGNDGRCGDFLLSDGTHPHPKTSTSCRPIRKSSCACPAVAASIRHSSAIPSS